VGARPKPDQRRISVGRSRQRCRQTALPADRYIHVPPTPIDGLRPALTTFVAPWRILICHGYELEWRQRRRDRDDRIARGNLRLCGYGPACARFGCQPARVPWVGDSGSPGRTDGRPRGQRRVGVGGFVTPACVAGLAILRPRRHRPERILLGLISGPQKRPAHLRMTVVNCATNMRIYSAFSSGTLL
jgi:hypothetical protein